MTQTIPVLFRNARDNGETYLTAILPSLDSNYGNCVCYEHVGQHGECSAGWYRETSPARPDEYADLLAELRQIYAPDVLRVAHRIPSAAWCKR